MVNKIILIGNLGKDPEVTHLESGKTVTKFSVATNENFQDKNGEWHTATEWHNVVKWSKVPERLAKGVLVYIEGKLTHRSYEDREGVKRYVSEVVASSLRICERKQEEAPF